VYGIDQILAPVFSKALDISFRLGYEGLKASAEIKNLRTIIRERLYREVRMNSEILSFKGFDDLEKVRSLDLEALNFIMSQTLPLEVFFKGEISTDVSKVLCGNSGRYRNWSQGILVEKDLVERWYHRTKLARLRENYSQSVGDLGYLKRLCQGLKVMLGPETASAYR